MIHVLKKRKCIQLGPTRQPGATDTLNLPKRHHPTHADLQANIEGVIS